MLFFTHTEEENNLKTELKDNNDYSDEEMKDNNELQDIKLKIANETDLQEIKTNNVSEKKVKEKKKVKGIVIIGSVIVIIAVIVISIIIFGKSPEVRNVESLIRKIDEITLESDSAINTAEQAFNKLSDEEKKQVKNADVLEDARQKYDDLVIVDQEMKKAQDIDDMITKIGQVTLNSAKNITDARKAYDQAENSVKERVKKYEDLEKAEQILSDLQVSNVIDAINAIGDVTLESKQKIINARELYDSLKVDLQTKITNYSILESSETILNDLEQAEKQRKLNEYLPKFSVTTDKVAGSVHYKPNIFPQYINTRSYMLPTIGVNDEGNIMLGIICNYTGEDWIFWDEILIYVDGKRFNLTADYFDINRDNSYPNVWEYASFLTAACNNNLEYDYCNDSYMEMLESVSVSQETIVRFIGDSGNFEFIVSQDEKEAIADTIELYNILSES